MKCPRCRAENPTGTKFCGHCAAPLDALAPSRIHSPEPYTPPNLAEKILRSRSALEGERKQVTVLFADLRGSMELLADRDPEEARKLLDPVLEHMMEAVHRYEGTVNQVMGDGIMALFGAPLAHEDHAVRGCYAALRMQEAVKRYAEEARRIHGVDVQIRVGLNSGEVLVRAIGSDLRMDYTAIGQTTHLAARMEQLATPGSIFLAPAVRRLVEGYVEVRSLGPLRVKGLTEPVEVCEVLGPGPARTRLDVAAGRGLTPFVGRETELAMLGNTLRRAADGSGQIVAVVGDAGVGKSRLLHELTHSPEVGGWRILEGPSLSYGQATSFLPVIELLKACFAIRAGDANETIREKLSRLLARDQTLAGALPALLTLLDVPVDDEAWRVLDPKQRRQRTLESLERVLLSETHRQPLLLIFEDLHWIDTDTQALLDRLVDEAATSRLVLLVDYRPEYRHPWGSQPGYREIRLDTLTPGRTEALLRALLGEDPSVLPLKRLLVKRGNPFFLEEVVRTLVETHALVGERGRYRLARPVETLAVPPTVQPILAARIDRLSVDDKALLQVAAVVGKDVPLAVLERVAERPAGELRRHLARLQAAEFLYETPGASDVHYAFKHALTHEVAYGGVVHERRRRLHARTIDVIEALYAGRLIEHVERLAHHASRGEVWEKMARYARQAGLKMLNRSANAEGIAYLEQALNAIGRLPETPAGVAAAIESHFDLRSTFVQLGDLTRAVDHATEAERLATTLGEQGRQGWASVHVAHCCWLAGDYPRAFEAGGRALAIAREVSDPALRAVASLYLGLIHQSLGEYSQAVGLFTVAIESLPSDLARERLGLTAFPSVLARAWLAFVLGFLGRFSDAISWARKAVALAEEIGHAYSLVLACSYEGTVHVTRGDAGSAIAPFERGIELGRRWDLRFHAAFSTVGLGYALALAGRTEEGIPLVIQALDEIERLGHHVNVPMSILYLAEAYLLSGRLDEARAAAARGLALARRTGGRASQGRALMLLGDVEATDGRHVSPSVADMVRQGLELGDQTHSSPLVARCHATLAKLYRRMGRLPEAHEHFQAAVALYRDMGMTYWLQNVEADFR